MRIEEISKRTESLNRKNLFENIFRFLVACPFYCPRQRYIPNDEIECQQKSISTLWTNWGMIIHITFAKEALLGHNITKFNVFCSTAYTNFGKHLCQCPRIIFFSFYTNFPSIRSKKLPIVFCSTFALFIFDS